jgi:hypothetical protein
MLFVLKCFETPQLNARRCLTQIAHMKTRPQISLEGFVAECFNYASRLLKRRLEPKREACAAGAFFAGRRPADRDDHVGPEALLEANRDCRLIAIHTRARREAIVLVGDGCCAACHHRHCAAHCTDAVCPNEKAPNSTISET